MHVTSVVRIRITPHTAPNGFMIEDLFEAEYTDGMCLLFKGHAS